jgi:C1A family cysteine protease
MENLKIGEYFVGSHPPPLDLSHIKGVVDEQVNQTYPPYYDLRNENKVTPYVKSQVSYSCWFHATNNSLESFLMPDEVRNFDAETPNYYESHGFSLPLGGDYRMSTAFLIRWSGPVDDPEEGYHIRLTGHPGSVQKHVQQVVFLPKRDGPLDNNTIKWFIMNYGAIYASLRYENIYYKPQTHSYYYNGDYVFNHGLALVGWDDLYDRTRFSKTPPGDGAFIARMSWGENWGENGYFYISYYDTSLVPNASFNNAEPADNYSAIYQYDPLGMTSAIGFRSRVYWGANVFTAVNDQALAAAGFYTNDANVTYDIYVYKNIGGNGPTDGILAAAQTGTLTYAGYYTVKLHTPVPLTTGERFSVVIRFTNPSYRFPVPIENPIEGYSHKAAANPGESFISADGLSWEDLTVSYPNSNVCIKAFSAAPYVPKPVIRFQVRVETINMWLITRIFGVVSVTIENLDEAPVPWVTLYRKENDERYQDLHSVSAGNFLNGGFTFYNRFLEPGTTYTYHATAYDFLGAILDRSEEQTVYVAGKNEGE